MPYAPKVLTVNVELATRYKVVLAVTVTRELGIGSSCPTAPGTTAAEANTNLVPMVVSRVALVWLDPPARAVIEVDAAGKNPTAPVIFQVPGVSVMLVTFAGVAVVRATALPEATELLISPPTESR